jgi:putative endonuclease
MDRSRLGREAEEIAARHLQSRGWTILGRNVRSGRREVDIIAEKGGILAFVEVKCRRNGRYGHPLEAITAAKREEIARVARAWLQAHRPPLGTTVRFDAVSVVWPAGSGSPRSVTFRMRGEWVDPVMGRKARISQRFSTASA